jgi:hypothetical protein
MESGIHAASVFCPKSELGVFVMLAPSISPSKTEGKLRCTAVARLF